MIAASCLKYPQLGNRTREGCQTVKTEMAQLTMSHRLLVKDPDLRQVRLDGQQVREDLIGVLTAGLEEVNAQSQDGMLAVLGEAPVAVDVDVAPRFEPGTLAEQRVFDLGPRQSGNLGPAPGHPQDGLPEEVEPLSAFSVHLRGL